MGREMAVVGIVDYFDSLLYLSSKLKEIRGGGEVAAYGEIG